MNFEEWEPIYKRILIDFDFDRRADYRSSVILSRILSLHPGNADKLKRHRNRKSNIIGNGPNLEGALKNLPEGVNVVADSAISVFYRTIGVPEIIVSDLDGDIGIIRKCQDEGSSVILHAHGDNIVKVKQLARDFLPDVIGTTQSYPLFNVHNFGGFTDGDRAAFLMDHLGSPEISIVGFNFDVPGFKENSDASTKLRKLGWARELLEILAMRRNSEFHEGDIVTI